MSALDDVTASLNANTNIVAAELNTLNAQLTALQAAGAPPTTQQIAALQAISDHLAAMGATPSAPIPSPAPVQAAVAAAVATAPVAASVVAPAVAAAVQTAATTAATQTAPVSS